MTPLLEVRDLDAGYEGSRVVRGIELEVAEGEIVAMLGPNGAGKTTTLRAACGLLPPMAGAIRVMGEPLPSNRPAEAARRGASLVPESRALFQGLTTRENIRLGARGRKPAAAYANAIGHFPELEPLMDRRAGLLSGGEQQMLAVARALVAEPRLLIVDEMSLGLAPMIVRRLLGILRTVRDELGAAVLFVEQYVDLALEVADRAVVLQHGVVALQAPAAALRGRREVLEMSYLGEEVELS
jgi:branched-chain amino acid transport system ATP-binding protein